MLTLTFFSLSRSDYLSNSHSLLASLKFRFRLERKFRFRLSVLDSLPADVKRQTQNQICKLVSPKTIYLKRDKKLQLR